MKYTIITTKNGWLVYRGPVTVADNANAVIADSWTFHTVSGALDKLKELLLATNRITSPKPK